MIGFAALGVLGTLVWWGLGHPHTSAFHWGFQIGLGLAVLAGLLARSGQRMHRFGVVAAGVFVASGMANITSGLIALAVGTHHVGRAFTHLGFGVLVVAFFGGSALLNRRMFRPDRVLSPELVAKAQALTSGGPNYLRVHLVLADGRQVLGVVTESGTLARAPKGVSAGMVLDISPAPRR